MNSEQIKYPAQSISILDFTKHFGTLFPKPVGLLGRNWPPKQVTYLDLYLKNLGCKTIIEEKHYIDRDFILDLSVFYSRSLRNYPNFCSRLHFLSCELTESKWNELFDLTIKEQDRRAIRDEIQKNYVGFSVIRPLAGSPIGRTVLHTYPSTSKGGSKRLFGAVRQYRVHLAGLEYEVQGLAFQQQDQGVSACATTALWSSLHKVTHEEHMLVPTPAQITEAASKYLLAEGRSLPSEGLNLQQICEAIRGTGLQPIVTKSVSIEEDRAQLLAYVSSGFPPVLALQTPDGGLGHAVCCVGVKLGDESKLATSAQHPNYCMLADTVEGLYVNDDQLGPYASTALSPWTKKEGDTNRLLTSLQIHWPDKIEADRAILKAIIVPVPDKIRMPISRVLAAGAVVAELAGLYFNGLKRPAILHARYALGTKYREEAFAFGLSRDGLRRLCCETVLSRFVAIIEISAKEGHLFDVLIDTTETRANPSLLVFVKRKAMASTNDETLKTLAEHFGAVYLS